MIDTLTTPIFEKEGNLDCNFQNTMLQYKQQLLCNMQTYLENCISNLDYMPSSQGYDNMPKINRTVILNGKRCWIQAKTEQEYAEKILKLCSVGMPVTDENKGKHNFEEYALNWYDIYSKPNIETATAATYKRQLTLHLIPAFGAKYVEDISTDDIQCLFNGLTGAKSTKDKVKMVLNMILENALEDGLIQKNPLSSKRLKISGNASQATKEYSVGQMRYLIQNLDKVQKDSDRAYLAIQALHPLRLEEVLGLTWDDIDFENMIIHIRRAVTHPTRNHPEIKATKTEASVRDIGLSRIAMRHLSPDKGDKFVFGGDKPLSYTQVRKMCDLKKIQDSPKT